jgi:hypothetical protein
MADVVDEDTVEACRALWLAAQQPPTSAGFLIAAPQMGRLKSPQALPYATITSELSKRDSAGTGGVFHDYRKIVIKVWGVKADVVTAMQQIGGLFNLALGTAGAPTLTYPSTQPVPPAVPPAVPARFMRWWPSDGGGDKLEEDKDTYHGQDIWTGSIIGIVWSIRL